MCACASVCVKKWQRTRLRIGKGFAPEKKKACARLSRIDKWVILPITCKKKSMQHTRKEGREKGTWEMKKTMAIGKEEYEQAP